MAMNLTGLQMPRPMTYQLSANLVAALAGTVNEARVMRLDNSTYFAELAVAGPAATGPATIATMPVAVAAAVAATPAPAPSAGGGTDHPGRGGGSKGLGRVHQEHD